MLLCTLALSNPILSQIAADETSFVEHEVLVMLGSDCPQEKILRDLALDINFTIISIPSPSTSTYLFNVAGDDWVESVAKLKTHRHVRAVQLNHYVSERETEPNDPDYGQQWHHSEFGDHDIDSDLAWDVTTGGAAGNGARIVVAVLEGSGSNYNHTDLIDNHWTNDGEIPNNGIDDDNNGYVDDYNGWNVGTNDDNIAGGGHGTSVSGMIGAAGNNGDGGVGVNWDVDIMQVDMAGGLTESNVIAAYEYPKTLRDQFNATGGGEGAFVVATNASWGIDQANPANYPVWCAYYNELGSSGILNCGATANQSWNIDDLGDMPTGCSSDYMVSVTATNNNDVRTFSGYGVESIDLGAPGEQVYLPSGSSTYGFTSGTSFASPCVAGAIALIYSVPCPNLAELAISNPQQAADMVRGYILDGVDVIPNLITEVATGGRLNVANSINLAMAECGPLDCSIESFSAIAECSYDAESETTLTTATLSALFSNDLCSADLVCFKNAEAEIWTCELTDVLGGTLSTTSDLILTNLDANTSYDVFFTIDTLNSDTITFVTPNCGDLVPGCTDPDALNYDEAATIDDGGCEYPCTDVALTITTDCWPEEVGWSIVNGSGEVFASVEPETYLNPQAEEVWQGCLVNDCYTLTITDEYGDGMFGSQWTSCDVDGNYVLNLLDGAVLISMDNPDYGDAITHDFCLPPESGCTNNSACNYNSAAVLDDASCYFINDVCDDGDEDTVFDSYNENCECQGIPIVFGCMDQEACNYNAAATNPDDCIYPEGLCVICSGEDDGTGVVVDNDIDEDGICDNEEIVGCQDDQACNYNIEATDAGTCSYLEGLCDTCSGENDGTGVVVDNDADDDGICDEDEIDGCQDPDACNYNSLATDEGECSYVELSNISGNFGPVLFTTEVYSYPELAGSTYEWTCTAGAIQTGNGTNEIEVIWSETGSGEVCVTETNSEGCIGEQVCAAVAILPTNVEDIHGDHFTIYPNPASTSITISTEATLLNSLYRVSDVQGKLVMEGALRNTTTVLNTVQLSNGQYTLTIIADEVVITKPLIIQK